ncbi:helix-turn-helix domain-containing protein [Cryptosporangium phraense]|uniref:Helix-turn-helix domain-containing protein n=1 Tax=Cryptosporangium phraense TaxID=2593070 RepID=A0A545AQS0_9ACTN|nr:helix-turn-helix transcriptional regulator [Cryptosporangium phraense]TQS43623.1 helix-turn-helix domain-containing protein [Cryptosporangium phraense]
MPSSFTDPNVLRRRLRGELRRVRGTSGLTQKDVASAMDWHPSKLARIETGTVRISINDLRALLNLYGVADDREISRLVALARNARRRSWWDGHRSVASTQLIAMLGYESSAAIIRDFEPVVVPGLLQTEDYARSIIAVQEGDRAEQNKIDALIDLRMERQEMFDRSDAPEMHFLLDESVLHRIVGSKAVMSRQTRRIREIAGRPNVTVHVVPYRSGFYPMCHTGYIIFQFTDPADGDILHVEYPLGELIFREAGSESSPDPRHISPARCLRIFEDVERFAIPMEFFTVG